MLGVSHRNLCFIGDMEENETSKIKKLQQLFSLKASQSVLRCFEESSEVTATFSQGRFFLYDVSQDVEREDDCHMKRRRRAKGRTAERLW